MKNGDGFVSGGALCGLAGSAVFMGIAVILEQLYWQHNSAKTLQDYLIVLGSPSNSTISMGSHLLVGFSALLFIPAFLALVRLLESEKPRPLTRVGGLFGVISCPILAIGTIVQGTIMVKLGRMYVAATGVEERQTLAAIYSGIRTVDLGFDLAFDLFFFTGWILLGFAMLRNKQFGRMFGAVGIILFGAAAVLNAWSAPNPPSFETAPMALLWVIAVYVQMLRQATPLSIGSGP